MREDAVDYETQRKNMVESQVRPSDVTDRRIIRTMLDLPRERFVPEAYRSLAYMDGPVPLAAPAGHGARRALLSARTLAKLVQIANIDPDAAVLDIGAGTGYGAALLGRLAGRVVALDSDASLLGVARRVLPELGADDVTVVEGELAQGWSPESPYDAIVIEGAVEEIRPDLLDQLKDGGRLVAIVGAPAAGRATLWRRNGNTFGQASIFDATADILPSFEKARTFAF
ncbi:protein-L-isoaspartate O-methyltransferase [Hyphomicrobium sp. CS1GBMeth3]|uniref:protein-L-isoaspartate O-methyltransferase family protein n=1 Tax=Hyphomicrobium sp. CS1GBMeth3 TaxID=1892845 RepID=UPI000931C332|nr:protein-L-isoaspartate O-methyltransferase [Hyphomicrobium sp. CS1GBMeth3]